MTGTSLIFDYLENIENKKVDSVVHIEDSMEMSPNSSDVSVIYTLYEVTFKEEEYPTYYIATITSSANVLNKADEQLLKEIFPDFYAERYISGGDGSSDSKDSTPTV